MLAKATLTHLESLETLTVQWNPQSYRIERHNRFASSPVVGGAEVGPKFAGGAETFLTRLFFDSTEEEGEARDLRPQVLRLHDWSRLAEERWSPPTVLFNWGDFRFGGMIESLEEDWLRFDPDGTPTRAWVDLVLRSESP
ncbi:MAG: hypothetical protein MK538_01340 [Planctomycetes bacterium]|nr:hypothetical protein [Planctomycetota bacterium]